jgi:hypothetical protein
MPERSYYGDGDPRRIRRFTLTACALGLGVGYAAVLPLKWHGMMPDHMTWLTLVVLPLVLFGGLAWLVVAPLVFPRKPEFGVQLGWGVLALVVLHLFLERR